MWGPSPVFVADDWRLTQSELNIDGDAGTTAYGIAGDLSRSEFLRYDVTNLAYHLPQRNSAAIIGVGGGRDVLSARVFGVPRITPERCLCTPLLTRASSVTNIARISTA